MSMTDATTDYQNRLQARIADLLSSYKQPTFSATTLPPTNGTNGTSITLSVDGDAGLPNNMDLIQAKLQGSLNNKGGPLTGGTVAGVGILDLQISNFALFLVLLALLCGTIYYWVCSPVAKDQKVSQK